MKRSITLFAIVVSAMAQANPPTGEDPVISILGPISVDGRHTLRCWNREYQPGNGFLKSIKIAGREVLASPISVTVRANGVPEVFTDQSIGVETQSKEKIVLRVVSRSSDVDLTTTILAENDGFIYVKAHLVPRAGKTFELLKVDIPFTLPFTQMYSKSISGENSFTFTDYAKSGFLPAGEIKIAKPQYAWLGNDVGGVQVVVGEDVQKWSGYDKPEAMVLYKKGDRGGIRMTAEPDGKNLKSGYDLEFGLIATPVKPFKPDYSRRVGLSFNTAKIPDLSDISQAKIDLTGAFAGRQGALEIRYSINKANKIGFKPAVYDLFGLEGPGLSNCHAWYDRKARTVGFEVQTNARVTYRKEIKTDLAFAASDTAVLGWDEKGMKLTLAGQTFRAEKNVLAEWSAGPVHLVLGGRGAENYSEIRLNGKVLPLSFKQIDLPTTHRFETDGRTNILILEEPGESLGDLQAYSGVNCCYEGQGWCGIHDYPMVVDPVLKENLRRNIREMHRRKMKFFVYTSSLLSTLAPDFAEKFKKWGDPEAQEAYNGGPGTERIFPICVGCVDYENWKWTNYEKTFKDLDIDGLFMDGSSGPYFCKVDVPGHRCGITLPDGRKIPRYCIFDVRGRMKRIWRTFKPWKKDFFTCAHVSTSPYMFTLAFADHYVTGEQWGIYMNQYGTPLFPQDQLRAEFVTAHFGIPNGIWADGWNLETAHALPLLAFGLTDFRPMYMQALPYAWRAMDRFGMDKVQFKPFWEKPFENTFPAGVLVSAYVHPGRDALIVVANYSSNKTAGFRVKISPERLIGKSTLEVPLAVDYVRGFEEYPVTDNQFKLEPLDPFEWTMIYVK